MIAIGIETIISVVGLIASYSLCYMPLILIGTVLHYAIMGNKNRSFTVPIVFALFEPVAVALPLIAIYFINGFLPKSIQKILLPRSFWQSILTGEIVGFIILVITTVGYITLYKKFFKEDNISDKYQAS